MEIKSLCVLSVFLLLVAFSLRTEAALNGALQNRIRRTKYRKICSQKEGNFWVSAWSTNLFG